MAKHVTSREGATRDSTGRVRDDVFHAHMLGDDAQMPRKTITPMDDKTYELLYGKTKRD